MNINGKIKIFTKGVNVGDNKFLAFTTSISHKEEDDTYLNASLEVRFVGDMYAKAQKLAPDFAYDIGVNEGWLDVLSYQDKEGQLQKKIYVAIKDAQTIGKGKKLAKANNLTDKNNPF